jgi:hypothetical protein
MSRLTNTPMIATESAEPDKSPQGRRKLVLSIAVASVAVCTWYLLDSGFCFSQMRYLSDKELIVEAIRYNADDMKIDGTDASIGEFLKQNPKCCYVDRYPSSRDFLGPVGVCLGINYSEVVLNYERRKPTFPDAPFYEKYVSISACGREPHGESGMSHATLQQIN